MACSRIKGWKRTKNRKNFIAYARDKDFKQVSIIKLVYGWQVATSTFVRKFKTKAKTLAFARNWMKKHPRG